MAEPAPGVIVSQATIVITETSDRRLMMYTAPLFPMNDGESVSAKVADVLLRLVLALKDPAWKLVKAEGLDDVQPAGDAAAEVPHA